VQLAVTANVGIGRFGVARQSDLQIIATNTSGLFNFENLPANQYLVGHVSVENTSQLVGLNNISQLSGCYDLSNFILVNSVALTGGTVSTTSATTLCGGIVNTSVSGASGPNSRFVLLNGQADNVLSINQSGSFNFDNRPVGTYRIVHITYGNAVDLSTLNPPIIPACLAASNQLVVQKLACKSAQLRTQPNPSKGQVNLSFSISSNDHVNLSLYDINGRKVAEMFHKEAFANETYVLDFDGSNLPNGIYICKLTGASAVVATKLIIAR
jgi:hypothetical protein